MMQELGYCTGIENYSRHLDGRKEGDPPATLLDYFPDDFVLFADESHISIPQVGGMFKGDRSRKTTAGWISASGCRPLWITGRWNFMNFWNA